MFLKSRLQISNIFDNILQHFQEFKHAKNNCYKYFVYKLILSYDKYLRIFTFLSAYKNYSRNQTIAHINHTKP